MNNNQTSVQFSSAKYLGIEKDQPFPNQIEITVTRSGNTNNYDSVELHLGNRIAQEGFDFGGMFPQWIDFQPGQTEKKVYIDIYDDFELEGTESIELKLIGDAAILGEQNTTTVSILDNETTYLEFESAKYSTFEQDDPFFNQLEITVTRSGNIDTYTTAYLDIIEGSADFSDFHIPNFMVDFNPGETSKTLEIEVPNDWNLEGTETFQLQLVDDPYNTDIELGENDTTTVEILDKQTSYLEFESAKYSTFEQDDPFFNQLEITVTRSGNIDTYTTAYLDIIEGSADFSDFHIPNFMVDFNPGETSKTLEIEVPNDWNLEGTETFQLQLVDDPYNTDIELGENDTTTVEILDKQTSYLEFESAKYSTFEQDDPFFNQLEITVTRSGNIDTYTTAYLDIIEGSADFSDFHIPNFMVDFNPGETSKTLEIEVPNDWNLEGTETFQLQLVDDPYNTDIELGENDTTTVEILDKQTSYLEFESAKYSTFEQDDPFFNQLEITVTRSGNIDTYTTAYLDIIEGSADFSDFHIPNFMVDFNPGETSKTLEIEVPNDWNLEGTETFQLQLVDDPYNTDIELGENDTTTVEILDKQTSYLEFESAKYSTFEQDDPFFNQLEITVTRSGNIDTYTTAYLDIIEGSADFSDFHIPNFMVDFNPGETSKTLEIEVPNDWNLEGTETFQLQLVDDPYNTDIELGENDTTTVEILDKQTSYLEFESAKYSTFEQDDPFFNQLEITVTRSGNIDTYTTAYLDIIEGSADFSDFHIPNFMVDFNPGETSKTLEIEVPNDWNLEGTETFQLQLVDDPYNTDIELGENDTTTVEILDKQTSYLEFESAKYSTFEQDDPFFNQLEITVTRSGNIDTYTTAYLDIIEGSADFSDFHIPNFMVDFNPGETSKTLEIEVPNDWNLEGTETFQLQLVDDPYNTDIELGENDTTTVEILDKQTSYLEFESAKYSTFEQDDPFFNQLEITVTRSGNIDTYTTAYLDIIEGSADFSDFHIPNFMVDFNPGETSKTLEIEVPNDWNLEGTETFQLQLVDDPYNTDIELGENDTTTVEILDKQTSYLEFESAKYSAFETNGNLPNQIEIIVNRLGNIDSFLDVEVQLQESLAQQGLDFDSPFAFPTWLAFSPGESSKSFTIDILDDYEIEGTETLSFQLIQDPYTSDFVIGEQDKTTISIFDDETSLIEFSQATSSIVELDSSPTVEFGSATYTINENEGLSLTVTLNRNGDTSFDSWVSLAAVGGSATLGSDYGFNNLIYFAQGETSKAVEIFLDNDSEIEGTETIEFQLLSGQEDDNYIIGTQDTTTVEIVENVENNTVIAEIGEITNLNHESQTIFFDHNFINPVIFAGPLSYNGPDPSTIRITDIQSNSFSVQLQETTLKDGNSHNGNHTTESFSFLVVEQGIWELSDGSILEVGNITTDAITTSNWETINFNSTFTNTPVVLTQVQTDNDATFVRTRQQNATNNGFQVALEEEEAFKFSGHGSEIIAWLAISPGQGNWDGNQFIAGNTGDQVTHNWHTINFGNNFINAPKFLGNIATFDGPDSSGLRYQTLTNGNVQIMVEEDTSQDSETNHTTEDINFFAIEADGNLMGSVDSLTGLVTQETGTNNADSFVLGNASESLYDNYGQQDYAEISNFDVSEDIIQLHGLADDYYLGSSPFQTNDQAIFLKVAGMEDELVGIIKNTNTLDINSNNFAFV
ncbi:Calx-beta domain-containing protein [Cyanothece sp. BG0011]|uniref:Calx-beta domain-containing protein n=1 Tax=Cyanothece sp. BG0011 TaxID=2082950 RepID=UPI000D1FD816|nr:Calx-beta domain-containing protein [Cyanothece sp. BG0011]